MFSRLNRAKFMALGAGLPALTVPVPAVAQTAPALPALPPVPSPQPQTVALARALVLSGGGALGAYEAGVLSALIEEAGVRDGQPLAPYGVVCGTSIGAFNAYLIATAQYSKLRDLWGTVARQNVIRVKPQYAKIHQQSSGVFTRVGQALGLALGLDKDVQGVLDGEHLRSWLLSYLDFTRPVVTPVFWAVTNLTMARPEYFYLPVAASSGGDRELALASLRLSLGPNTPVRQASSEVHELVDQVRASAAVPLAFDPVTLTGPDGKPNAYADGGVTANTPIDIARALALRVDAILLNPEFESAESRSGVDIAEATFSTMQRRLLENSLRSGYFEAFALRALQHLPPNFVEEVATLTGVSSERLHAIAAALHTNELYVLRPKDNLPIKLFGFSDEVAIAQTYGMGQATGSQGFKRFEPGGAS